MIAQLAGQVGARAVSLFRKRGRVYGGKQAACDRDIAGRGQGHRYPVLVEKSCHPIRRIRV